MELHHLPASQSTAPLTSAGSYLFSDPKHSPMSLSFCIIHYVNSICEKCILADTFEGKL
jgi:hypothetical protein